STCRSTSPSRWWGTSSASSRRLEPSAPIPGPARPSARTDDGGGKGHPAKERRRLQERGLLELAREEGPRQDKVGGHKNRRRINREEARERRLQGQAEGAR